METHQLSSVPTRASDYVNAEKKIEKMDAEVTYGPIAHLMKDPTVEEIWINSPERIFVARNGKSELSNLVLNAAAVRQLIDRILMWSGRRIDLSSPFVDAQLPDGSRLHVVIPEITAENWCVNIRKHLMRSMSIGDFNMIDANTALVIERDNGEGTADRGCADNKASPNCFHDLAKFKRVVKIEMNDANVNGPVRKIGYIDLMKIQDPQGKSRKPLNNGVLTFPFFTIENVDVVDDKHIIVGNDNNLPFSSSRDPNKADDNEFILLEVESLLRAR